MAIPKRFNVAVMLFVMCLMCYMMRVNLSINIIAMTSCAPHTNETLPDHGPRYHWDADDQALLLGAYFYGHLFTALPGGVLAERYGGKPIAGYTTLISAILTALTPLASKWGIWPVFIIRFITGFFGGVVYPCCHNLIAKWAPPTEKGRFVAALMGGTFGTVVTWPISGVMIEGLGWHWAFYGEGLFCIVGSLLWFLIVDDSPAQHSTITPEERELIESSLGQRVSKKKKFPPFKSLLLSMPFFALLLLHYGNMWGLFFVITAAPKYMNEVLGFKLSKAAFSSSLPHLARIMCAFSFGAIADRIVRRELLTVTQIRKYFCIFSHVIPGVFLIIMAYVGRSPYICVALMTLSLGFNGSATVTDLANAHDLAPNYAATLYGLMNNVGTTSGFLSPLLVAHFTEEKNTFDEWEYIFLIGAGVYIVPALVFFAWGSVPKRFNVAVMLFVMCLMCYMMRVNLSINIIAMTSFAKHTNETLPDHGPRYYWDAHDQALLLGAYFYGFFFTSFLGGMLAERFGGKSIAGYTTLISSILTALTPLASKWGIWPVFVIRFITGFFGGFVFPSCHNLISKWAMPTEKGKFLAALMGGTFGTVVTWPLSGLIIEALGWHWAFYSVALFNMIGTLLWFIIVDDSPAQHSSITPEERELIETALGHIISKDKKKLLPFKRLLFSLPFWALLFLHYGNVWGVFFLITAIPKFMNEVLGFKLSKAGFSSSLPPLARIMCAFTFGAISDRIIHRKLLTVTQIRKYFCMFCVFLIIMAYFGNDPYVCVALMSLSLGFNGSATVTNLANAHDLAPNYAATLYGAISNVGATTGFLIPMIVAHFTKDHNTLDEWDTIFLLGAALYIIPALVFFAWGSGEIQPWNTIDKEEPSS